MIIIINGAPGSGKTKTAEYLFLHTDKSAWIDGDTMLGIQPQLRTDTELDLREENIAAVARNYYKYGYTTIFVSFVYMGPMYLSKQINLLSPIDTVKVIALVPDEAVLRERHVNDDYKREGIEPSIEINRKIKALDADEVIDNSHMSVSALGEYILEKYT